MYNVCEVINMTSALEAMMLICFGFSWPINLIKNIKAKTAKSMSLKFIILIILGYVAGISAKLISHNINYVLVIYLLNLAIVSVNVVVYFINAKKDKENEIDQATTKTPKTEIEGRFSEMNKVAESGAVVFFGTDYFANMPIRELGECFSIEETLYNRSVANKSIDELCDMTESCIFELMPSKIFINIGETEAQNSTLDIAEFVEKYEWLLYTINANTDADIYIVSVMSENSQKINDSLKNLANQYGCKYIDITSAFGTPNHNQKAFSLMKMYMRKHPIGFYEAMNM